MQNVNIVHILSQGKKQIGFWPERGTYSSTEEANVENRDKQINSLDFPVKMIQISAETITFALPDTRLRRFCI